MTYYISRSVDMPFELVVESVIAELAEQGFGILSDIDVSATLDAKLGTEFRPYRILGACNPSFAHQALEAEDKIGTLLPCNVVVQQLNGNVEIAAVNPEESMRTVGNPELQGIADQVKQRLTAAIEAI